MTHQTAGDIGEKEGTKNGAQKLSNPVENSGDDGQLATGNQAEGDGGVDVSARDVGGDGDSHEQSESMGDSDGHQPGRVETSVRRQTVCSQN